MRLHANNLRGKQNGRAERGTTEAPLDHLQPGDKIRNPIKNALASPMTGSRLLQCHLAESSKINTS
jgi:hypothetical protein